MFERTFQNALKTDNLNDLLEELREEEKQWTSWSESHDDSRENLIFLNQVRNQINRVKQVINQEIA